jgi:hypothetical protein
MKLVEITDCLGAISDLFVAVVLVVVPVLLAEHEAVLMCEGPARAGKID